MPALDSFKLEHQTNKTFVGRAYHGAVVHNGKLYIMMGLNDSGRLNSLWWTQNGNHWERLTSIQDTQGNAITARDSFGLVEHEGKVYLMGGWDGATRNNEVYVSGDMVQWTQLPNAPWSARYGFCAVSFNNRLYVLGGNDGSNLNDVWWTTDGVNWTQSVNAPWAIRRYACAITYNRRMFVLGGIGASSYNDVWETDDGRNWVQMESSAAWAARSQFAVCQYGDMKPRMLLSGGELAVGYSQELWNTGPGNQWKLADPTLVMGNIRGHTMTWFRGRAFIVGGANTVLEVTTYLSVYSSDEMFGNKL